MANGIDFYQIYFKDEQLKELYPFAIPYKNNSLTPYFENSVIAELVPKSDADYISVCSWRLKQKRHSGSSEVILQGRLGLSDEIIKSQDFDVAILTPKSPTHNIMVMSNNWHGKAWELAVKELRKFMHIPDEMIGNAIYENHFIARKEIYHDYVSNCLKPALEFMKGKEVFNVPSGYRKIKERMLPAAEVKETLDLLGMSDWPIAPFVLERLFRFWIHGKKMHIVNI